MSTYTCIYVHFKFSMEYKYKLKITNPVSRLSEHKWDIVERKFGQKKY